MKTNISPPGRNILKVLINHIKSGKVESNHPETFIGYKEIHDILNLPLMGDTYGNSLSNQGLEDLAEWTLANEFPAITGLIINESTFKPSMGYFKLFSKSEEDYSWWQIEIEKSLKFDWESYLGPGDDTTNNPYEDTSRVSEENLESHDAGLQLLDDDKPIFSLSPSDYPELVSKHRCIVKGTLKLEQEAIDLSAVNFADEQLEKFIRNVCSWGGYAGIAGRILNQNTIEVIRNQFIIALSILNSDTPDVQRALFEVNKIKNLGTPSFASKHLRFLCPELCPILDSTISNKLNYDFNPSGYKRYSNDCLRIGKNLQRLRITNPIKRIKNKWFAADIDMAIYAFINNL